MSDSSVSVIADHYNKKIGSDLQTRSESRIFYLRNFNNWIKSVLISEYVKKIRPENRYAKISVLDLGCGKGGDIKKWKIANVSRVTFVDIAEKSLEECKKRYEEAKRPNFEAEFIHLDATKELISDKISSENLEHDLISSQFVVHYSFESYEKANTFLKNVSNSLKTGGYFIGTTTNSFELIKRLKSSATNEFGNDLYKVRFEIEDKDNISLFGVQFFFELAEVVECPEFLINFRVLEKLALKHNLKLIFNKTFSEFFDEHAEKYEYKKLASTMQALEPFYSQSFNKKKLDSFQQTEYEYISEFIDKTENLSNLGFRELYATLSKSEWEAITLYMVFGFVKIGN